MARIRTIKPEFFRHHDLFIAEVEEKMPLRIAFAGLFTACDREGRFKWEPNSLKLDCLPYDKVDFSRVLDALMTRGFICKYRVSGVDYGCIPSFMKHQFINNREKPSDLPSPEESNISTREGRVDDACATRERNYQGEGKGREGKGKDIASSDESLSADDPVPVISIPLNTGEMYPITQEQVDEWQKLYPAIDVMQQLRGYLGWTMANPNRRKTKNGILRSINSSLAFHQDKYSRDGPKQSHSQENITYFKRPKEQS